MSVISIRNERRFSVRYIEKNKYISGTNSYKLWETLRTESLPVNLNRSCFLGDDRSIRVSHFHMRSRNSITWKRQFTFLPKSIFACVGTTAGTVNKQSERCGGLSYLILREREEKIILLSKLCPTVDQTKICWKACPTHKYDKKQSKILPAISISL